MNTGVNLTKIMREHGVKYVADLGAGFSVLLHGGAHGTGETVGAALANAKAHAKLDRIAA